MTLSLNLIKLLDNRRIKKLLHLVLLFIFIFSVFVRQSTGAPNVQVSFIDKLITQEKSISSNSLNFETFSSNKLVEDKIFSSNNYNQKDSKTKVIYKKYLKDELILLDNFLLIFIILSIYIRRFIFKNHIFRFINLPQSIGPPSVLAFYLHKNSFLINRFGDFKYGIIEHYGVRRFG